MLSGTGYNATYSLDLSSLDVSKVTNYASFNEGVTSKVTVPTLVY